MATRVCSSFYKNREHKTQILKKYKCGAFGRNYFAESVLNLRQQRDTAQLYFFFNQ